MSDKMTFDVSLPQQFHNVMTRRTLLADFLFYQK